jgi:hypothetical protein
MIGRFTTKVKFQKFISIKRKKDQYHQAIVDGKYFSRGGLKFKITLHEDSSIDLDEIDTNETTLDERARYVEIIEDKESIITTAGNVLTGIEFQSIDSDRKLVLSLEPVAPYADKISQLFEEKQTVSNDIVNKLEKLIGNLFDFDEEVKSEPVVESTEVVGTVEKDEPLDTQNDYLKKQFENIKVEKAQQLQKQIEEANQEIKKAEIQITRLEAIIKEKKADIDSFKERIKSLNLTPIKNGYQVFVSEKVNDDFMIDDNTQEIIQNAISKVKSINAEVFMSLFKQNEYHIFLYKDNKPLEEKDLKDVTFSVYGLCQPGKANNIKISDGQDFFLYSGEMTWHEIIEYFVSKGFEHLSTKK